ncbi:SIMPL domain-containing protein [Ramlibacter tataouinensis]|uniref:SIMPL domain-containing protein n=1 Tax=Ramlibacter tataouinensis TaxID=94132 RepID=UPI0005A2345F|nr:SIMPL domain-containing protein [Ramlibacter tataouinensis]
MASSVIRIMAACALWACAGTATAQPVVLAPPQNVLQLSASGTVETPQDLLTLSLSTTREGADPAAVQAQLKAALDAALAEARKAAQPGQMDVRTGNFAIYPRHGRDGRMSGWNGTAELVLEGRDFARITQAAGRIGSLTLSGVSFGLSREQRLKVEGEAQQLAIERFKAKADELAKSFGFSGYTLREVAVNANDPGFVPRPRMMAMEAKAAGADMAVPVEAGKSAVVVTVSGSVQLR